MGRRKNEELDFNVWLQPVMVPHWVRGEKEETTIVESEFYEGRELEILALGRSVGTGEDGITAEVIEVKNFEELQKRKSEVKGKIVFFSRPLDQGTTKYFSGLWRCS